MVRDVLRGHVGLDVLAIVAMVATLAVAEYVAALIIVLMLAGGEALEDFASRRARRDLSALLDRSPRVAHVVRNEGTEAIQDIPVEDVERLRAALDQSAGVDHAIIRYADAEHGFHCDVRPAHHPDAAKDAWAQTLEWFGARI